MAILMAMGNPAWPQSYFQGQYGTTDVDEQGYSVMECPNGNFIIVGPDATQPSPGVFVGRSFALTVSSSGDSLSWTGFQPATGVLQLEHVEQASDGDILLTGVIDFGVVNGQSDYDAYVARCDSTGQVIWYRTIGEDYKQWAYQSKPTPDGGIITAGWNSLTPNVNDNAIYLIRFTGNGDTVWTRSYPPVLPWSRFGYCLTVMPDGGYVVGGVQHGAFGSTYPFLMRTTSTGDTIWTRQLQSFGESGEVRDLLVNGEGNIVITGYCTATGFSTPYIAELAPNGDLLWSQIYDQMQGGWARSICATADGYAIGGLTYNYDFLILKTDLDGNYQWHRTFDIAGDYGYSIISTADGGFALAGLTDGPGMPSAQVVLIKTDNMGNVVTSTHDIELDPSVTATLFPNPVAGLSTFQYSTTGSGAYTLVLHDGVGRVVRSIFINERRAPGEYEEPIDLTGLASGTYTLVLSNGQRAVSVKAIKL